jgi:hypothetical protein
MSSNIETSRPCHQRKRDRTTRVRGESWGKSMEPPAATSSLRIAVCSVSTLFTLFLISGSVHCFQPASASPPRQNVNSNSKLTPDELCGSTISQHSSSSRENDCSRRNIRLSASTTIPSSFHKQHQPKSIPLLFRDCDETVKYASIAQLPTKIKITNSSSPASIRVTSRSTSSILDYDREQASASRSEARKAWERKYCSVAGLRESFGTNRNILWGDFDATITRRLYKCLLPVALLELYETDHVPPQDLAPLAYRARLAAKLYARERSHVPARIGAAAFDGYRQWRKYGRFDSSGMSYDQIWNKYAAMITQEASSKLVKETDSLTENMDATENDDSSVTAKICLKILERSCRSNEMIDRWLLNQQEGNKKVTNYTKSRRQRRLDLQELRHVSEQLERDVRLLLQQPDKSVDFTMHGVKIATSPVTLSLAEQKQQAQKFRALRAVAKVKRRIATLQRQTIGALRPNSGIHKTTVVD